MIWFIQDVCVWTGSHPNTEDMDLKKKCTGGRLASECHVRVCYVRTYVCMYVRAVVYNVSVCLSACNVCVNVYVGAFQLCIYVKKGILSSCVVRKVVFRC